MKNYGLQLASRFAPKMWKFYWPNAAISSCHGALGLLEALNHSSAHRQRKTGCDLVLGQAQADNLNLYW